MQRGKDAIAWLAIPAVVAALLVLPAGAYANAFYKGPVEGGANNAGVEFRANVRHDRPRKVVEFRWFNVPIPPSCADSFEGLHFSMKVKHHRKFHGRYSVPNTNHKAIVHGRFKHHATRAAGTRELKGNFAGGCTNVDTGQLHWTAKRSGT